MCISVRLRNNLPADKKPPAAEAWVWGPTCLDPEEGPNHCLILPALKLIFLTSTIYLKENIKFKHDWITDLVLKGSANNIMSNQRTHPYSVTAWDVKPAPDGW